MESKKVNAKVLTKSYPATSVTCRWKRVVTAGRYSLFVQPKAKGDKYEGIEVSDEFIVAEPEIVIYSTRIIDTKDKQDNLSYTVEIDLAGRNFSSKKATVHFQYSDKNGKEKTKKFKKAQQFFDVQTGASTFVGTAKSVPAAAKGVLQVKSKIGSDSCDLDSATMTAPADDLSRTWHLSGSMAEERDAHTGTLLQDGRVLIVGGYAGTVLGSVEIYNPATDTWATVEPLKYPRSHHTATLLNLKNAVEI